MDLDLQYTVDKKVCKPKIRQKQKPDTSPVFVQGFTSMITSFGLLGHCLGSRRAEREAPSVGLRSR